VADEREDSRLRIEAAAREEFRQHGFDGARIDRIARLSGLNKQLIYYYFGSKRELYAHTIRQAANRVRIDPTLRRTLPGTPADRLRVLLMTMVDRVARAPEIARALLQREGDAETATDAGRLMSELAEELGQEISRGQGLGYYRDDADPGLLGRQAVALLVGWGVLQGARGGQTDGDVTGWADATAGLLGRALAW
jgi:TetR/AcrR family transcriptional regulator